MKILVVDDESAARYGMLKALQSDSRTLLEAADGQQALEQIRAQAPDLIFLDLNMPVMDGIALLDALQPQPADGFPEIIVVTANDTVDHAVDCIRRGAADFLTKPYDVDHLRSIANRSEDRFRLQQKVAGLQDQVESGIRFGSMLGASLPMQRLFRQIDKASNVQLSVLIRGESGTGKELIALELHQRSARSNGPFVAVNTAAIAESLIESELFGHVKGAFTGADRPREGVFRQANGGTLFLDEIGDMPASVQTRLLRVLQEGVVQPVGSEETIPVDVRIISATHQDLELAIDDSAFRQDLYFRLKGIELLAPPLRSRQEDILLLANDFLHNTDTNDPDREDKKFSKSAVTAIMNHPWPGNVRELQQTMQAAAAMADGQILEPGDLGLAPSTSVNETSNFDQYLNLPLTEGRNQLVANFERMTIQRAIELEDDNVSAAARRLGIHRQSLQQKMKQLGLR